MNSLKRFAGVALCVSFSLGVAAQPVFAQGMGGGELEREIVNVTGDLYRFRETRHIGMFLVTPDGIVVVDPTNSGAAGWLKEQLDERFGLPVRYVIYSHSHNDHASGGEIFAETAMFVGHENMRKNLQRPMDSAPLLPRERLWDVNGDGLIQQNEIGGTFIELYLRFLGQDLSTLDSNGDGGLNRAEIWALRFGGEQVPPDIYYRDQASVTLGGKRVELHYMGRNHTDDMTVVAFPDERTIYTVDFLTPNRLPRAELDGGFLPDWIDSLRRVEELDFDIVVPGHEAPGTKAQVTEQRRYLEDLVAAVSEGISEGRTKEELVETVLMENYEHLLEFGFSGPLNVLGAYEILVTDE